MADFGLQNKEETTLHDGLETSGQRVYRLFWHISRCFWDFAFWMIFFRFSNNLGFGVFLVHPETTLPDGLETSGWRAYRLICHISRRFWVFEFLMIFYVFQKNRVLGYSWSTLLWYRCYYPHWSGDALSPVCWIFCIGVTIRIGREILCLLYAGFLIGRSNFNVQLLDFLFLIIWRVSDYILINIFKFMTLICSLLTACRWLPLLLLLFFFILFPIYTPDWGVNISTPGYAGSAKQHYYWVTQWSIAQKSTF